MLTASTDFNFRVAGQTVDLDVQITAIAASLDTVANRMAIAELENCGFSLTRLPMYSLP